MLAIRMPMMMTLMRLRRILRSSHYCRTVPTRTRTFVMALENFIVW